MTLSTHVIVASSLSVFLPQNAFLLFIFGFMSHFVLDAIPHWDYKLMSQTFHPFKEGKKSMKATVYDAIRISFDIFLGFIVALIFFSSSGNFLFLYAAVGSIVPDVLQFIYSRYPKGIVALLQIFHTKIQHHGLYHKPILGILTQGALAVLTLVVSLGSFSNTTIVFNEFFNGDHKQKVFASVSSVLSLGKNEQDQKLRLLFTGDVMMGRNVEKLINQNGGGYPFSKTFNLFKNVDFSIINLEGPIPYLHKKTESGEMNFSFGPNTPYILASTSIDIVSLANNHGYDKGEQGFLDTIENLKKVGVATFGNPVSQDFSYIQSYKIEDVSFSLIGFNATFPSFSIEEALYTIEKVKVDIGGTMIVFMHWGDEYEITSNDYQKEIAAKLFDAGVDFIVGAHPHVTQEIECRDTGQCVFYSLGNFIFDQYFSKDVEEGFVLYVDLNEDGVTSYEVLPIKSIKSIPEVMSSEESAVFLEDLYKRSNISSLSFEKNTILYIER
jgi:poly-gamma-glutamate synthesis protein (capsule biosynthesis protein)